VDNHLGETALAGAAAYLDAEIALIAGKMEEVQKEVRAIDERLKRLEEEGNY
jgi:hypothetical protein